MITSKRIISAMGCSEMSNTTLKHQLTPYIDISMVEVLECITRGIKDVDSKLGQLVSWVLGFKQYIPKDFNPKKRAIKHITPRQMNFDQVLTNFKTGKTHHLYVNGNGIAAQEKARRGKKVTNADVLSHNTSRIKEIICMLGGSRQVANIAGVNHTTVSDWSRLIRNNTIGYIPQKYIFKISEFARTSGINVTSDELEGLLP
jgi:hypothetical protein